ncbi:serine/threonine protein kinase [Scandinavium lactucae]|uniref:Serine/threonine-protein kinase n=1 Tax=Scandinavium lactucae TaxID=3095028 RepID=A0ABU4QM88_9ENTR|nr:MULTISPECIES: serine/threonine-protein kinase [unclassified Scandinavium]MDX6039962.1 serine/threonine-protein kinase [Scandinavium sp. V105_6]MDX6051850.1 serine/threonine-protein kinase [Scandinavium sp. V105_1]
MTDTDYTQRPPDALPPGYRFDEFEIQDVIDTSNDNIVYRALDHQLERQVAIREFLPRTLTVRSESQRLVPRSKQDQSAFSVGLDGFIHEARQLARLNHPNVVQILRFWTYNETAYAATPVYSGVSLADLFQQHPELINEAWLRRMLPMLCGALAALHDKGFIHCRLSLNSIQIQDNGLPLLLEFGALRQTRGESGEVNKTLLHPGFTPLEQYSDDIDNPPGPWTDIYSLGAILYTLITGNRPPASVTRSIQDNCVPLAENAPEGYSLPLLQAIDRTLALRPEDRPQTIAEFAALAGIALNEAGERTPSSPTGSMLVPVEQPPEESNVTDPWWKKQRMPLQIAAGVLVGLVAGGLLFGRNASTEMASTAPARSVAPIETAVKPAGAGAAQTRVYIHVANGDQLEVNGKVQKMPTPVNGYAAVQFSPGKYLLTLRNGQQTRNVTITVDKPGTWLVDPQA